MRGVVSEGVDQLQEMVADAVVGVVGGGAVAEREGFAEGALVCAEHLQSRLYRRTRCFGDNLLLKLGMLVADVLQELPHFVC